MNQQTELKFHLCLTAQERVVKFWSWGDAVNDEWVARASATEHNSSLLRSVEQQSPAL